MKRTEQLRYCKQCLNRSLNSAQEVICSLTGKVAEFENSCPAYEKDESITENLSETAPTDEHVEAAEPDEVLINKLRAHQDFNFAIIGGVLATIVSALIWAVITVTFKYQIGYMAIGVGLLVGFSVRFFGAGLDKKFGILGAFLSLAGCMLGNLFSQIGFIANNESLGYLETLSYLNFNLIRELLVESFNPMDLLFYGIALYEGYKFAFRNVTVHDLQQLRAGLSEGHPSNYKLRLPLALVSIVVIGVFFFISSRGVNGTKTFLYESGNKMSEGEMKKSNKHGKWTYWSENGDIQLICYFDNGLQDSLWQWFDESGKLARRANYKKGQEHGLLIGYYPNGQMSDSGNYSWGRMNGYWKYWYENGQLLQAGNYNRNLQEGLWTHYFENGQLARTGQMKEGFETGLWTSYYQNGIMANQIEYQNQTNSSILNAWDINGVQVVKDGNGQFSFYFNSGRPMQRGNVVNGKKIGEWVNYFEFGQVMETGRYEDDTYLLVNAFDQNGAQMVTNGNGFFKSMYPDGQNVQEAGNFENGLKEGTWSLYYPASNTLSGELTFVKGKLNGRQKYYHESGALSTIGDVLDDLREGEWIWYFENGIVNSKANFVNNKKEGKQIFFDQNGEIIREEIYAKGVLTGEKIY